MIRKSTIARLEAQARKLGCSGSVLVKRGARLWCTLKPKAGDEVITKLNSQTKTLNYENQKPEQR